MELPPNDSVLTLEQILSNIPRYSDDLYELKFNTLKSERSDIRTELLNASFQLVTIIPKDRQSSSYITLIGYTNMNMRYVAADLAQNVLDVIKKNELKDVVFIVDLANLEFGFDLVNFLPSLQVIFSHQIQKIVFRIENTGLGKRVLKILTAFRSHVEADNDEVIRATERITFTTTADATLSLINS